VWWGSKYCRWAVAVFYPKKNDTVERLRERIEIHDRSALSEVAELMSSDWRKLLKMTNYRYLDVRVNTLGASQTEQSVLLGVDGMGLRLPSRLK
jgi:hypothetical protein